MRKHDNFIGTTFESRPFSFLALQYCTTREKWGNHFILDFKSVHTLFFVGLTFSSPCHLVYFVKQKIQNHYYLPPPSATIPPFDSQKPRDLRGVAPAYC